MPLDESITQKRKTLSTADYWLKDEAAACWVQAWCQELKERRDSITTDGKIKLSPVEGEPEDLENKTRARLSKRLRETLSEPERRLCNEFCVAINEVEKRACCVEQILNEDELNRRICDIMDVQIRRHMDAVFSGMPDDECVYDESWGVGSAVGGFIEDWYKMVRYAAATLERYVQLLYWCVFLTEGNIKMLSEQRREDLNRLVLHSCNRIEVFWSEINAMTKMTKERYRAELHEAITKANERLNVPRELKNYLKQMMVKMGAEKKLPSDVTVTLYAGTVTLEFFWRVTAREYADNIIRMIRNLQEVQREQADKSVKNKG